MDSCSQQHRWSSDSIIGTDASPSLPASAVLGPSHASEHSHMLGTPYLTQEANCPAFINADLIADGLSPFAPERAAVRAGRIMLEMIKDAERRRESFAFETTLAARNYARAIPRWRSAGYFVTLIFLSLPSADVAVERVAERIRQGGHSVPEATIRRRFAAGLQNLERVYKPIVDAWILYDSAGHQPVVVDSGVNV